MRGDRAIAGLGSRHAYQSSQQATWSQTELRCGRLCHHVLENTAPVVARVFRGAGRSYHNYLETLQAVLPNQKEPA